MEETGGGKKSSIRTEMKSPKLPDSFLPFIPYALKESNLPPDTKRYLSEIA